MDFRGWVVLVGMVVGAAEPGRRFILEDAGEGLLCAVRTEAAFLNYEGRSRMPAFDSVVEFGAEGLAKVLVRRSTEDTTTYDEYVLGRDGEIKALRRTFDYITRRISRDQVWRIRGGRAEKVSEAWTEFRTEKPVGVERIPKDLFQSRIFVRVADFPFWRLVRERWTGERRCVAGSMRGMNR
jgi:hypothetical protein